VSDEHDEQEEQSEEFAAMLEASLKPKRFERGQTIEGRIVGFGQDVAFVDVGGKGEAAIDLAEVKDADGNLEVKVGDRIQATVVSTVGGLTLSRKLIRGAANARQLEDAFHAGLAVDGKVESEVKGGYEVRIAGQRAFCPYSQIDVRRAADSAVHIGQVYQFKIIEFKEGGQTLVVSRRALIEEEQRANAEEVRKTIVPGAVLTGRVASVREFGAFVDFGGGIQGLLHVSEMGFSRVTDPGQIVTAGEEITVKVLRVDEGTQKISLSLKQLLTDPWLAVETRYEVGQVLNGRVTRVAEFGAFVELEPGIEALAHASTFPPTGRRDGWTAQVPVGLTAPFEILTIERDKKRIGVALVPEGSARAAGVSSAAGEIVAGAQVKGKVERHESFGVFVFLAPGKTGLIPLSETGVARDGDVAKTFPIGSDVEVIVLEVEPPPGRRIRLSVKAVQTASEAAEVREYRERPDAAPAQGLGSLADKLRGALTPRQK
jgi:small subunit ribosomal protein S1